MKYASLRFVLLLSLYRIVFSQLQDPRCSVSRRKVTVGTIVTIECLSNQVVSTLTVTKDSNILQTFPFAKAVQYQHVVTESDHNSRFTCIQTSLVDGTIKDCSIKLKLYTPSVQIEQSQKATVGSNITLMCSGTDILGIYSHTLWNIPVYFLHPTLRAVVDKKRTHVLQLFNIEESDDRIEIACSLKSTAGMWNASKILKISPIIATENKTNVSPTDEITTTELIYDVERLTTIERVSQLDGRYDQTMIIRNGAGKRNLTVETNTDSTVGIKIPFFWVMFICATVGFTVSFCSVYLLIRCICSTKQRGVSGQTKWVFGKCSDHPNHYSTTIPRSEHGSFSSNKTTNAKNFYITCANDISNGYDSIKCTPGNDYLEPIRPPIRDSLTSCGGIQALKCHVNPFSERQLNIDNQGNNEYLEPMHYKQLKEKSVTDSVYSVPFGD